jgi:hypothetical protein
MMPAREGVDPVSHPVRPRDQQLTTSIGASCGGRVSVDHVALPEAVRAQSSADLDDACAMPVVANLDLGSRRVNAREPRRSSRYGGWDIGSHALSGTQNGER